MKYVLNLNKDDLQLADKGSYSVNNNNVLNENVKYTIVISQLCLVLLIIFIQITYFTTCLPLFVLVSTYPHTALQKSKNRPWLPPVFHTFSARKC